MPIIPHDLDTFKEGLPGLLIVLGMPFILLWLINKIIPVVTEEAPGA
jgi:hypothetical protein